MHNYQPQKFIFSDRVVLGLIIFVSGGVIDSYGARGYKTCKIAKLQIWARKIDDVTKLSPDSDIITYVRYKPRLLCLNKNLSFLIIVS